MVSVVTQPVTPCCVTVKICPAIVIDPVRDEGEEFCVTEYDNVTVPPPEPLLPDPIVIHELLLEALHDPLQPDGEPLTETDPGPPCAARVADCADKE